MQPDAVLSASENRAALAMMEVWDRRSGPQLAQSRFLRLDEPMPLGSRNGLSSIGRAQPLAEARHMHLHGGG